MSSYNAEAYEKFSETAEDTEMTVSAAGMADREDAESVEESELYVKFRKPFRFEDDVYNGIDLSGLENLTSKDLGEIEKKYYRTGVTSFNPEITATYAMIAAQRATGMPIEFFEQLPAGDMIDIKRTIVNFLFA